MSELENTSIAQPAPSQGEQVVNTAEPVQNTEPAEKQTEKPAQAPSDYVPKDRVNELTREAHARGAKAEKQKYEKLISEMQQRLGASEVGSADVPQTIPQQQQQPVSEDFKRGVEAVHQQQQNAAIAHIYEAFSGKAGITEQNANEVAQHLRANVGQLNPVYLAALNKVENTKEVYDYLRAHPEIEGQIVNELYQDGERVQLRGLQATNSWMNKIQEISDSIKQNANAGAIKKSNSKPPLPDITTENMNISGSGDELSVSSSVKRILKSSRR